MFENIKLSIEGGLFELADILHRIDVLYASAALTDDERERLIELAREKADPSQSYGPLESRVEALELALKELAARVAELDGGTEPGPEPADEWPEYVAPTGAHDAYNTGDQVTYQGKRYRCKMDGCVWDPVTYPSGWEYVEDAPAEDPAGAE